MSDREIHIVIEEEQLEKVDILTNNRSKWIRTAIQNRLESEYSDYQDRDYNNYELTGGGIINPDEADFSDTGVVKTVNRPSILAGILRYWIEVNDREEFPREELLRRIVDIFGVTNETAQKYLRRIIEAEVLIPHLSIHPDFSGTEALKSARRDLTSYFEERVEYDKGEFESYPHFYRYQNSLPEMTGTPDHSPWMVSQPVLYPTVATSFDPCRDYLRNVARMAPSTGNHDKRYASKYVFSRLVAAALDNQLGGMIPQEVDPLLDLSPYDSFSMECSYTRSVLNPVLSG